MRIEKRISNKRNVDRKFNDPSLIEGYDYIVCKICGAKRSELGGSHMKIHNMTNEEYKKKYNVDILKCRKVADRIKGSNNPGYQHGGTLSPFSKKSLYHTESQVQENIYKANKTREENPQNQTTKIEYWTSRGHSKKEAKKMLSKRQTTFSLEICIEKYGLEDGTKRWNDRQEKWLKNFKRQNWSMISQKLFNSIVEQYDDKNVYFATHDRDDMHSNTNKEYRLKLQNKSISPDFIDVVTRKIIEFDGDYWHGLKGNVHRDRTRDEAIIESGYDVLHIKECDYKEDPEETVKKCINFLTK